MNLKSLSSIKYFFLLMLLHFSNANAQDSTSGKWMMNARINYGFLIAHRPTVVHLQKTHVYGFEAEVFRTTTGEKDWEQVFNKPLTGVGFLYLNLGDNNELGNAFAVFPQLLFPLNHSPHLLLSSRIACGIGFIQEKFDRIENHKNVAISTHLNCIISFGFYARAFVHQQTQIVSGIEFTHLSNGGFKVPNLGVNIPNVNLGISHFFGSKEKLFPSRVIKEHPYTTVNLLVAGGIKEVIPAGGKKHGALTITGTWSRSISFKSCIGAGADVFYDHSIVPRLIGDSVLVPNFTYAMRSGIHVSYELKVQKLSLLFENGIYLYNRYIKDGSIYTRLCLRYHFSKKYFAVLNLKSHFAKADYFEYGIGMRLNQKSHDK